MRADDFRDQLHTEFAEATQRGASYVDINSGELHRKVGGYPGPDHSMPSCCQVMYAEQTATDRVLNAPPKEKGASLTIRYQLPRRP